MSHPDPYLARRITRRDLLRATGLVTGSAALAPLLSACGGGDEELVPQEEDGAAPAGETPGAEETPAAGNGDGGGGEIIFLSTQLNPIEEAEAMRNVILADFEQPVNFIPEEAGPFVDRVLAESQAGNVTISVLGGLHGDFSQLMQQDLLMDLTDLVEELGDREFAEDFLELANFGQDGIFYIPWLNATYIMAARQEAMEFLPDGADLQSLTYEQWAQWGANMADGGQGQRLGWPAGADGLIHRFFQGYAYPSFTGALNTAFATPQATEMWEWMRDAWQYANPQSTTYAFMQEPLRSREVWVAWDHVARLLDALNADPEGLQAFPAPAGPEGTGYMPVVAGLAIPQGAPNEQGARDLISYLTRPETTQTTLREVGFFPPFAGEMEIPEDLGAGIANAAEAVQGTTGAEQSVPSLLPIGLGDRDAAYNNIFRTTFEAIVVEGQDIQQTLEARAQELQQLLDDVEASCWRPDPESDGVCQVGMS